jgi:ADP-ribose pyrophosphatase YjhB (NUDIX family)
MLMKNRDRAFAAIINNGKIVMVHVKNDVREFWTLPGGGVEEGESLGGCHKRGEGRSES